MIVDKHYIVMMPRHAGKSWLRELMGDPRFTCTVSAGDKLVSGELGSYEGMRIIIDEISDWPKQCNTQPVKSYQIQHGPVRKGRGGKVRKW